MAIYVFITNLNYKATNYKNPVDRICLSTSAQAAQAQIHRSRVSCTAVITQCMSSNGMLYPLLIEEVKAMLVGEIKGLGL